MRRNGTRAFSLLVLQEYKWCACMCRTGKSSGARNSPTNLLGLGACGDISTTTATQGGCLPSVVISMSLLNPAMYTTLLPGRIPSYSIPKHVLPSRTSVLGG